MNLIPMQISLFLGFLSIETLTESDLTIGKKLGSGSFGEVFECYLSSNDTIKFAIKFIRTNVMENKDVMDEIKLESRIIDLANIRRSIFVPMN